MHPIEVTFLIVCAMDRLHQRTHLWNQLDYGKISANVQILQGNGVVFDTPLIEALANGDESHQRLKALAKLSPLHYKLLNDALDHIFELANEGQ